MKLNRITIETPIDENNPARGSTKKSYDLTSSDFFWVKNAGLPFPQVAEDIDTGEARTQNDWRWTQANYRRRTQQVQGGRGGNHEEDGRVVP